MSELHAREQWWNTQKNTQGGIAVYLISSPEHVYAEGFIHACVSELLDTDKDHLSAHPDFSDINPFLEEGAMKIEDFRDAILALQTPPQKAKRRVAVVHGIDILSAQGQNALLKSIEEPRVPTTYFLLAHAVQGVLPTIRSRAIIHSLQFILHEEWTEKQRSVFEGQSFAIQAYLEGRPGLVDRFMKGKRESAKIEKTVQEIQGLLDGAFGKRLAHARVLAKKYTHAMLMLWLQDALLVAYRLRMSSAQQKALAQAYIFAKKRLNKTFILDHIIFETYALSKTHP